jgi:hypothetical protein
MSECGTGLGWAPASDLADALEIDDARIGAGPDHDHLRPVLVREPLELFVIDPLVVFSDAVRDDRVQLARKIQRMSVSEVTAVREVHAENRIARLEEREIHGHVRLCA